MGKVVGQLELWKPIMGFEDYYEVSNLGRVRSLDRVKEYRTTLGKKAKHLYKGKILKSIDNHKGYMWVHIRKYDFDKMVYVHRLVANAFIDNDNNKPHINHIDGIKSNNNVHNLEWCTRSENMQHASRLGLLRKSNA